MLVPRDQLPVQSRRRVQVRRGPVATTTRGRGPGGRSGRSRPMRLGLCHRVGRVRVVIVVSVVLLALALPATALGVDFRTPGRAAYCDYVPVGETIEGGVPNPRTDLFCWTPNDGFFVDMHATGRVRWGYADMVKGAFGQTDQVLAFGERWSESGFRCVSRRSGPDLPQQRAARLVARPLPWLPHLLGRRWPTLGIRACAAEYWPGSLSRNLVTLRESTSIVASFECPGAGTRGLRMRQLCASPTSEHGSRRVHPGTDSPE
jgi:hypothetical protein